MVIALFAALIGPWFVNWNDYKATFEAEAEKIVGRPVHVVGSASATLLPSPSLTFEDVTVGDVAGEPMMTVDRFEITIELMPLLQGQFRITSMRLDRPRTRVVVNDAGRLDWQARSEASKALDPENVILDRLEIVDGRIDYSDRIGETDLTFEGVNAVVEARSLLGPWRIEGSYLEDGVAVPFRFATGRLLDDGTIRVKTDLSPAGWPVALAADGILGSDDDGLYYDGTYNLTQIVMPTESAADEESGAAAGWRSEGKFRLTRRQLAIAQAVLSQGPAERAYSIAGSLTVALGAKPHFEAHATARQIDLDRSLGNGPTEPVAVSSAAASLIAWLKDSFVPPVPGSVFFKVPGIVVGGAVIQDVAFEARPTIGGWRIVSLDANLPGRATLEVRGVLATDFEVGFAGNVRLIVNQPALFAAWWRGKGQVGAGRLLAPFEIAGRAELSPVEFNFEDVEAMLGDAAVRGRFAWGGSMASQRRVVEAELVADSIDFVQLKAFLELAGGEGLANATALADSYDIKLSTDTFQIEDVAMHDVAIDASYAEDALTVNEFSIGDLGGAHVNVTRGRIESLSGRPQGHLDAQLEAETLDAFSRVVERILPDHAFSNWLRKAGPSLAPAFVTASIEAPAREGDADIRANLAGVVASTTLSAAIDVWGSIADWRQGEAGVEIVLESPDAAELARQAGLTLGSDVNPGVARLEISASGVPASGLDTRLAGEFAGVGLRSEGRLALAADDPPTYAGSVAAASDDIEPLLRMVGLGIPVAAVGNAVRIDGDLQLVGASAVLSLRGSQIADRLIDGRLSLAKAGEDAWSIDGDLHVDAVDLGWITAVGLGFALEPTGDLSTPWSRTPFGDPSFSEVSGKVAVTTDDFAITDSFNVSPATLAFNFLPNRLSVDLVGGRAVGGSLGGGLSVHNVGGNARLTGRIALEGAALEQLLWRRGGRAVATGVIDLSGEFEAAGRSPAALASSLTGGGAVAVRNGMVRHMNPQAARLVIRASDLGQEFTENELRQAFTEQIDGGSFAFDQAEGAFAVAAGVVRLKSLAVDGEEMDASGDAVIDLTKLTIDSDWTVTFDPGDDRVEGTVPQVGIVFRGPLGAPERIIDVLQFGSYLNIRQEERLLELLSQAEADRLEADRLNREKRKLREDAERRVRVAAEAEAARIAAEAEDRRQVAEAAAQRAVDEAQRIAAEAEKRRVVAEAATRNVSEATSVRAAAEQEAERLAAEAEQLERPVEDTAAKAAAEAEALSDAEAAARDAAAAEAAQRTAAAEAAQAAAEARQQQVAVEEAVQGARAAQATVDEAKEAAAIRAAEAEQRRDDAEAAASQAADQVNARAVAEQEAQKRALDAERRKQAAEAAAGVAADKVMASAEAEAGARQAADEATQLAAEVADRLDAARQAVEAARAEVVGLEAAKRTATEEADRILASATEKLRGAGRSSELGTTPEEGAPDGQTDANVTEEEANRLRAEVALAIQVADDAGRALADAKVALTAAEEEVARLETETDRSRAAAGEASSRGAEAIAALSAAEDGAQTAKANAESMKQAATDAARRVEAAKAARLEAESEATRLSTEAGRLTGAAEAAAGQLAEAESARAAGEGEIARLQAETERLKRIADEAAERLDDENTALQAASQEAARLAAAAAEQRRIAEEAAAAADAAKNALQTAEDAAAQAEAEAERQRRLVDSANRAAEEAKAALEASEADAARIAAEAEKQRLAAEEATRKALEVSVPQ